MEPIILKCGRVSLDMLKQTLNSYELTIWIAALRRGLELVLNISSCVILFSSAVHFQI